MLHPTAKPRQAFVSQALDARRGPVVASTDYMRAFADQIRQWVPGSYRVLGTDGFGRSDFRRALRRFFEVDRHYVAVAALKELAELGEVAPERVAEAIEKYGIDPEAPMPSTV
jgi:pyruvate dehydrogenase E1 component